MDLSKEKWQWASITRSSLAAVIDYCQRAGGVFPKCFRLITANFKDLYLVSRFQIRVTRGSGISSTLIIRSSCVAIMCRWLYLKRRALHLCLFCQCTHYHTNNTILLKNHCKKISSLIVCIRLVAFLLFLAPAGGSNTAGK